MMSLTITTQHDAVDWSKLVDEELGEWKEKPLKESIVRESVSIEDGKWLWQMNYKKQCHV